MSNQKELQDRYCHYQLQRINNQRREKIDCLLDRNDPEAKIGMIVASLAVSIIGFAVFEGPTPMRIQWSVALAPVQAVLIYREAGIRRKKLLAKRDLCCEKIAESSRVLH